ncbi:MAG TPA: YerC/YecD family TrpR-related protein [Bacillota bacterium]|nr:TrpR-like protein, YerC/YecD [Clostridiales bacterium]HPT85022.1 YerC/YecD family TrpR-related protein [Bacillota bacterium]
MSEKIRDENTDFLFRAILTLENIEECYKFFEDLCTVSEIKEMSKRLKAAKMLRENYIYTDIAQETGLSTATISRVNRCLKYGSDGYIMVLERLERERRRQ